MAISSTQILQAGVPQWVKVGTWSYDAFAATTQAVIYSLPANAYICDQEIIPTTLFEGGTLVGVTATIGTVASPSNYTDSPINLFDDETDIAHTVRGGAQSTTLDTDIIVELTPDGDTLDHATQGEFDVYLLLCMLP
jgi:hypothetical protein